MNTQSSVQSWAIASRLFLPSRSPNTSWRLRLMRVSIVSGIALSHPFVERFPTPLDQLHPLQARVPVLADDDVVVHRDAEGLGDVDDLLGHLHVGARGRRVARGVVVDQHHGGGGQLERAL